MRIHTRVRASFVLFLALAASSCQINQSDPPALSGPSELGTSVTLFANPDVLTLDGRAQSQIVVEVRDANSQPRRDVPVRAEIFLNGILADIGRLSARTVVTGSDGRASITYTAPLSLEPSEAADPTTGASVQTIVTILVTPSGTNFASAVPRQVEIRLVPQGVILPPNGTPVPRFTVSTPTRDNTPIRFDATSSTDDGAIVSFTWDFGDGTTASGSQVTKTYTIGGTYNVTLTVVDDRGLKATTTQQVVVETSNNPTASFTISPTNPSTLETVFFNASASTAATGRKIVSYAWQLGDGDTASGVSASNRYSTPGTYNVVLTVTDDAGKAGTIAQLVTVGAATRPTSLFVYSPTRPTVGQPVVFDGALSTAPAGRTIVAWEWQFGDNQVGTGQRITHIYNVAASGNVVLTVTDSAGQRNTSSQTITVDPVGAPANPTASFTTSPASPTTSDTVFFDAGASTAPTGRTIVSYNWTFGDGANSTGSSTSHRYTMAASYTVTLTVTDDTGRSGIATRNVVVTGAQSPVAAFTVSPTDPVPGALVQFDASTSTAPTGATITAYAWNFGDPTSGQNTATGPIVNHAYAAAGTFTVSVTVTDSQGRTATLSRTVTVK